MSGVSDEVRSSRAEVAISFVLPAFNEVDSLAGLLAEIRCVGERLGSSYEVVVVDDGSSDGTGELLAAEAGTDAHLSVVHHTKNCGQARALLTGIEASRGATIVTMDADGQNDPTDVPALLDVLARCDLVVGVRATRRDSVLRRAMSRVANAVRRGLLRDGVSDSGCALKAFRREVAEAFLPIQTLYSFIPALAKTAGFRVLEREVRHRPRRGGESKYGLRRMAILPLIDLVGVWWFCRRRSQLASEKSE